MHLIKIKNNFKKLDIIYNWRIVGFHKYVNTECFQWRRVIFDLFRNFISTRGGSRRLRSHLHPRQAQNCPHTPGRWCGIGARRLRPDTRSRTGCSRSRVWREVSGLWRSRRRSLPAALSHPSWCIQRDSEKKKKEGDMLTWHWKVCQGIANS